MLSLSAYRDIERSAKSKLASFYSGLGWTMTPIFFFLLSASPLAIYLLSNSFMCAFWALLFACVYCAYSWYIKGQRERVAMVLGIVCDPIILELVTRSMPGWVLSDERNRVDWLNLFLHQMWPMIGHFAENKILTKAREIFNQEKPDILSSMDMSNVSAGTIPPKIVSIHVLNPRTTQPKSSDPPPPITFEIEFVWDSDGYVIIEIGFLGKLYSIEVCNLRFSGRARVVVEPSPINHSKPAPILKPIKLVRVTFLEAPNIDLTVSFGDLLPNSTINAKVMGLGPVISQASWFLGLFEFF